jgi:hypothetical protein
LVGNFEGGKITQIFAIHTSSPEDIYNVIDKCSCMAFSG